MILAALLLASGAMSQVIMADALKPADKKRCTYWTTKDKPFCIGIWGYSGGFSLSTGQGGLVSSGDPGGYAVFNLGGAYEKISFVMGPYGGQYWGAGNDLNGPNANSDNKNVIVTVSGDDETLLDEVVWNHDTPREVVLNVKGVKQLRFDVLRGETDVAFGALRLWKAGQKPVSPNTPLKLPAGKVTLVKDLWPYYYRKAYMLPITDKNISGINSKVESISINRVKYTTGL